LGPYRGAGGPSAGGALPGLPLFSESSQEKVPRYGSALVDLQAAPGSHGQLLRQSSQILVKEMDRLDRRLNFSVGDSDAGYLSPDLPLIYVSCISILVLLYFVLFVDGTSLVSLPILSCCMTSHDE
jgi:hypothetical protein